MRFYRPMLVAALVFATVAVAEAGVGLRFGGANRVRARRPFNFAVSTTQKNKQHSRMTAAEFTGHGLGPRQQARFGGHGHLAMRGRDGGGNAGGFSFHSSTAPGLREAGGPTDAGDPGTGGGGGGGGGGIDSSTNQSRPFNASYCFCPVRPGGDGDDDDDDDTGGPGGGGGDDDDDDDDTGGGGPGGTDPDPSVVPEPTSLTLWALASALLVGVTRRRSIAC